MYCRQERVEPFVRLLLALALQRRQVYRVAGALARVGSDRSQLVLYGRRVNRRLTLC
jgi:hypothetical protein